MHESITAGEQDYTALVSKLKAANVEVIYFGGYHPEAALIVKQAREQGLDAQLLSGDSLNTLEFATLAGNAADGVMFTNAAEARNLPTAKTVVESFRKDGTSRKATRWRPMLRSRYGRRPWRRPV